MSVIELAPVAIERVTADVALVPLFDAERPLGGAAGRIDWRLCGRLSQLVAAGRIGGGCGSAVLTPGGGGVRARSVIALGLGARADLDAARFEGWLTDALARAAALGARRLALALPECGESLADRLAALASRARTGPGPAEIAVAAEGRDAPVAIQWFRSMARRAQREGLEIRPPAEGEDPHGGSTAAPTLPQPRRSSRATAGRSTR